MRDTSSVGLVHKRLGNVEFLDGTKEQIQAAGFGVGLAFPSESGANKRRMTIRGVGQFDHVSIECLYDWDSVNRTRVHTGRYWVWAHYLPKVRVRNHWNETAHAPGIRRHEDIGHDVFIGAADVLIAAGLVEASQLPGQPGCGQTMTTFLPDGTRVCKGSNSSRWTPGSKTIKRQGRNIVVSVSVDRATENARRAVYLRQHDEAIRVRTPALTIHRTQEKATEPGRRHLRLVWSSPA